MQIILNEKNQQLIIDKAVNILGKGGMVVYPSDTVYGIAADATNESSVGKLDRLKDRRNDQKYSYNFSDIDMVKKFFKLEDFQEEILNKYLPGPYTFVLHENLSVRIPKDCIIVPITASLGKPTTATSANITGKTPATNIKNLDAKIYLAADLLIEGQEHSGAQPSTVVDIITKDFKVLRPGSGIFP